MPRIPRMATYGLISTTLFSTVIFSALHSRPNFYSASVAVGRSSGAMMVLGNFAVFLAILVGMGLKSVFFGRLRSVEYEHLFERLWLFLTESLLALTIFRDDFSVPFAVMYGILVFLKCFHWITADRVDYMDQVPPPGPPVLFHIRTIGIITLLTLLDILLVMYSLETILVEGVSAMVLFGSEYLILLASISGTSARYTVNVVDIRRARGRADAPSWEEKSMWMFYIDLAVDFAKLLTYLSFFAVILMHYGIPLHILRDVWMTFRSFLSRCSDLVRYRRATRDMDAQYPDATEEDVGRLGDRVCIICREEMVVRAPAGAAAQGAPTGPGEAQTSGQAQRQDQGQEQGQGQGADQANAGGPNETPKKLVCGHVFHFHCLRSWLERQQSCPTCRRDVLHRPSPITRNSFNRPARPAPGAQPVPNGQANLNPAHPTPAPAPGQAVPNPADALRAQFNEFFRLPAVNGAIPTPQAADRPTQDVGPQAPPAAAISGSASGLNEEDARLQKSIWGGPIQPGRFFASPLGAAPRIHSNGSFVSSPSSSIRGIPSNRAPSIPSTAAAALPGPTPTPPQPPSTSAIPVTATSSPTQRMTNPVLLPSRSAVSLASGSTTPLFSQSPQIFRSTGDASLPEPVEEEPGSQEILDEVSQARRAAAQAAMRRLGGEKRVSLPLPVSPDNEDRSSGAQPETDLSVPTPLEGGTHDKGKGKEKEQASASSINGDTRKPTAPAHIPYLTPVLLPPPHPQPPSTSLQRTWGAQPTVNMGAGALDERLRVLREVDEVIWGLVGDLTRLQSQWEVETQSPSSDGSSHVQPRSPGVEGTGDDRDRQELDVHLGSSSG